MSQNAKVWMSRCMDTSSTTQMAKIMVQHWRSRGSSCTKIVRTPTCSTLVGKTVWRRSSTTRIILGQDTWMTQKWLERGRKWLPCGRNEWNRSILENRHHFLTTKIRMFLNVNAKRAELLKKKDRKNVRINDFCWNNVTITRMGETSHKNRRVVQRHGRTCSKLRYKVSSPCFDDHQFKQENSNQLENS